MRRFGLPGFLLLALLVGAVGVVAYNAGISTGAAEAAIADGATVVYQPAGWSPFGIIIGFFFLMLIFSFIGKAFFWGRMPYGPGGLGGRRFGGHRDWDREDVPEPFRPMLERWHRQAHADGPASGGAPGSGGNSGATPPGPSGAQTSGVGTPSMPGAPPGGPGAPASGPAGPSSSGQPPSWPGDVPPR